jgi:hypothetical protein
VQLCKKLKDVPSVMTEWQQTTWCPDCDYYNCGACANPTRISDGVPCPFDGESLPLVEVTVNSGNDQVRRLLPVVARTRSEEESPVTVLKQAIRARIVERTGGRIQLLDVEATNNGVIIRGRASRYYLKQLALEAVREVVGLNHEARVKLEVLVQESASMSVAAAQYG